MSMLLSWNGKDNITPQVIPVVLCFINWSIAVFVNMLYYDILYMLDNIIDQDEMKLVLVNINQH